jgi:hypothetical protein
MVPIWNKLPKEYKGDFYTKHDLVVDIPTIKYYSNKELRNFVTQSINPLLISSYNEFLRLKKDKPLLFMEHGAGQTYLSTHPNYSGGRGMKNNCLLFLCPNEHNLNGYKMNFPNVPSEIIGCPKLDKWHNRPPKKMDSRPIVAISFHWDCQVVPETRSGFNFFKSSLGSLSRARSFKIIGHGHPNIIDELIPVYEEHKIEVVRSFDEVLDRADLYVCDNSSTLFEFASLDRPVVVLNPPYYRRSVEHGLRFWEYSDIGYNCDSPYQLKDTIRKALKDEPEQRDRRREITNKIYPVRGNASEAAVYAILYNLFLSKRYYGTYLGIGGYSLNGISFYRGVEKQINKNIYDKLQKYPKSFKTREEVPKWIL